MPIKLKYSIAIFAIFIIGLSIGFYFANNIEKSKQAEVNQVELAHTILSLFASKEVKEIQMLSQVITGMSERKPIDSKSFICKLVELKVAGLEFSREEFMGSTTFKDNPTADSYFILYNKYIDIAKISGVRAGCRK